MAAQSKRDRAVRVVPPAPATPATPRHTTGAAAAQQRSSSIPSHQMQTRWRARCGASYHFWQSSRASHTIKPTPGMHARLGNLRFLWQLSGREPPEHSQNMPPRDTSTDSPSTNPPATFAFVVTSTPDSPQVARRPCSAAFAALVSTAAFTAATAPPLLVALLRSIQCSAKRLLCAACPATEQDGTTAGSAGSAAVERADAAVEPHSTLGAAAAHSTLGAAAPSTLGAPAVAGAATGCATGANGT